MTTNTNTTKPSQETILAALVSSGGNASAAARELGIPERTFRRWAKESQLVQEIKAEREEKGETVEVSSLKKRKLSRTDNFEGSIDPERLKVSPEELMKDYGLSPDEYRPTKLDVNQRDGGTLAAPKIARAINLTVQPVFEIPKPAFSGRAIIVKAAKTPKPIKLERKKQGRKEVLVISDLHCPYEDPVLVQKMLNVVKIEKPDQIIVNGDGVDFPSVGRHRQTTKRCTASANDCINSLGDILKDLRSAAGVDCEIDFIFGNHDAWLNNYVLDRAGELHDLSRYDDQLSVFSFEHLLRFDDLNIKAVGNIDQWEKSSLALTPNLVVRHGNNIDKKSGGSTLKGKEKKEYAEIIGHVHRQAIVSTTCWTADGERKTYQGAELGGLFRIDPNGWPTYTDEPNWQQGFATVSVWEDGHYAIDLASYQNGELLYRGERI